MEHGIAPTLGQEPADWLSDTVPFFKGGALEPGCRSVVPAMASPAPGFSLHKVGSLESCPPLIFFILIFLSLWFQTTLASTHLGLLALRPARPALAALLRSVAYQLYLRSI